MESYILPILVIGFFGFKMYKFQSLRKKIPGLLEGGAIVVDVRSVSEFKAGARPGSLNIPLQELNSRYKELDTTKTIILCCASGTRSGIAVGVLKKNGLNNVVNAGPWTNTLV